MLTLGMYEDDSALRFSTFYKRGQKHLGYGGCHLLLLMPSGGRVFSDNWDGKLLHGVPNHTNGHGTAINHDIPPHL